MSFAVAWTDSRPRSKLPTKPNRRSMARWICVVFALPERRGQCYHRGCDLRSKAVNGLISPGPFRDSCRLPNSCSQPTANELRRALTCTGAIVRDVPPRRNRTLVLTTHLLSVSSLHCLLLRILMIKAIKAHPAFHPTQHDQNNSLDRHWLVRPTAFPWSSVGGITFLKETRRPIYA